jgi:hypothetical protein
MFFPPQFFHNPFISRAQAITALWNHYFCNISSTVGREIFTCLSALTLELRNEYFGVACTFEDLRFGSHGVLWFVLLVLFQGVQLRSSELILPRHHYARMVIVHTGSSFPANPWFPGNQNSVFNTRLDLWVSHTFCFRSWRCALISLCT